MSTTTRILFGLFLFAAGWYLADVIFPDKIKAELHASARVTDAPDLAVAAQALEKLTADRTITTWFDAEPAAGAIAVETTDARGKTWVAKWEEKKP